MCNRCFGTNRNPLCPLCRIDENRKKIKSLKGGKLTAALSSVFFAELLAGVSYLSFTLLNLTFALYLNGLSVFIASYLTVRLIKNSKQIRRLNAEITTANNLKSPETQAILTPLAVEAVRIAVSPTTTKPEAATTTSPTSAVSAVISAAIIVKAESSAKAVEALACAPTASAEAEMPTETIAAAMLNAVAATPAAAAATAAEIPTATATPDAVKTPKIQREAKAVIKKETAALKQTQKKAPPTIADTSSAAPLAGGSNPFLVNPNRPSALTPTTTPPADPAAKVPAVKKTWECDCGKINFTSKLFCMECGMKRTPEMVKNAKKIEL
jgi:hypothetical protein